VLDLISGHCLIGGCQHRAYVLATASATDEPRHQVHWQGAMLATEPARHLTEVHIFVMAAVDAESVNTKPSINHRANRRVPGWIEFLSHLTPPT
jgi:hypothetical protein